MRAGRLKRFGVASAVALAATVTALVVQAPPASASSITVNTAIDIAPNAQGNFPTDGKCSLRAAITAAQDNSNEKDVDRATGAPVPNVLDTIQIDPSLTGATYTLTYAISGVVQPFPTIYGSTNPLKIIGPTTNAADFKISGGNAVFNPEKLDWFNQQHIMRLPADDVLRRIRPDLEALGWWSDDLLGERGPWIASVIELLKPRAKKISDIAPQMRAFLSDDLIFDDAAVQKHLSDPLLADHLRAWTDVLEQVTRFDAATLEASLRSLAEVRGIKPGVLIHATRVAVTGQGNSPGLFDVLELAGRDRVVDRLAARCVG